MEINKTIVQLTRLPHHVLRGYNKSEDVNSDFYKHIVAKYYPKDCTGTVIGKTEAGGSEVIRVRWAKWCKVTGLPIINSYPSDCLKVVGSIDEGVNAVSVYG